MVSRPWQVLVAVLLLVVLPLLIGAAFGVLVGVGLFIVVFLMLFGEAAIEVRRGYREAKRLYGDEWFKHL